MKDKSNDFKDIGFEYYQDAESTYLGVIILPDSTSNLMTSQIEGFELDFPNTQFFGGRMLRRLMLN